MLYSHEMRPNLRDFFFTIDLRSLALYRICLALLLLYDIGERWIGLGPFYTAGGVLPIAAPAPYHWSLFDALQGNAAAGAGFAIAAVAAVALLAGARTRVAHGVVLAYLVSARNRNPLLSSGADCVLLAMTLWTF